MTRSTRFSGLAALVGLTLLATACSSGSSGAASAGSAAELPAGAGGRVAVSYEGGIAVLDASTLEVVQQFESEEFTRLNAAGDGKHVFITTADGFQLLDTATPELTSLEYKATTPGHVVRHAGRTVLFDDGTGTTTIIETAELAAAKDTLPQAKTYTADAPHHGVSIQLEDGTLVTTVGDETSRSGARALTADGDAWKESVASKDCPGIHGEGTAAGEAVIFGCENGALLYHDGEFEKFKAPDTYGRMGNAFVSETSPIVVGDYKNDPDAEGYLLNAVTLIDTAGHDYEVVDLPDNVQYTFRDVARGPGDLAYILSTDGSIHVLDPKSGDLVKEFPVVDAWEGPAQWQDAHPAIIANGDTAYVTEPAKKTVHAVDLTTGEVTASVTLDGVPNEIAAAL
ncbi:outer membrane protein assembly factor BamB [Kineosporia succinea]|uniref:Outer membrane protein assembly factor BamB n=2 Tax=Kineosporia succinea TaxID=84632 RepID=A0ABT9PBL9_9ACTN|nr:zinc metallochaperone AztD [Kineosporia succinea]MDP9830097.1 outer membrane protein assembly factor BamB [Kineosporia succinea]